MRGFKLAIQGRSIRWSRMVQSQKCGKNFRDLLFNSICIDGSPLIIFLIVARSGVAYVVSLQALNTRHEVSNVGFEARVFNSIIVIGCTSFQKERRNSRSCAFDNQNIYYLWLYYEILNGLLGRVVT